MTENELIQKAQAAISSCNWTVGECASLWCEKYARGRTDADFGSSVGLSGDQVYSRRRVSESFADVRDSYPELKWSHFYVALTWQDSAECLGWANENQATVAEMKAWRRMQNGEDLTVEAEPFDSNYADPGKGDPILADRPEPEPVLGSGDPRGDWTGSQADSTPNASSPVVTTTLDAGSPTVPTPEPATEVPEYSGNSEPSEHSYSPFRPSSGSPADASGPAKPSRAEQPTELTIAERRAKLRSVVLRIPQLMRAADELGGLDLLVRQMRQCAADLKHGFKPSDCGLDADDILNAVDQIGTTTGA